jgi:sodium/potassium-transporting ATPase subunit alpha
VRNRRVSIINSNPLWGPRKNLIVPVGMIFTALIAVVNLYGPGFQVDFDFFHEVLCGILICHYLQRVFSTTPIPGMYWGLPFTFALGILIMDETRKLIVRRHPSVSNIPYDLYNWQHADHSNLCSPL